MDATTHQTNSSNHGIFCSRRKSRSEITTPLSQISLSAGHFLAAPGGGTKEGIPKKCPAERPCILSRRWYPAWWQLPQFEKLCKKACLVTAIRGLLSARRSQIVSAQQQAFARKTTGSPSGVTATCLFASSPC